METNGQHIARIKNNFKLTSSDTVITNRFIFSLMKKHRAFVVNRDVLQRLVQQDSLFQTITFEELVSVDSVEACNIKSECRIKRTKDKIPGLMENNNGVVIRWVGGLDGTQEIKHINSNAFQRKLRKPTFKYNKEKYYWFRDGYLYFPNVEWDAVRVEGYFTEDIINECVDCGEKEKPCINKLDEIFRIPEYLVSSMDQLIYQDLSVHVQLPYDEAPNDNENLK